MSFPDRLARRRAWMLLALATLWVPAVRPAQAEEPEQKPAAGEQDKNPQWVRVLRDDKKQPLAMQTAIVRYKRADGQSPDLVVDLIGAVHIGDKAYYDALNLQFAQYDALLFELVAPEGTKIEPGAARKSGHPVGAMQNGMKDMLELEHQLERVDYSKENFVHADMSPEQFAKSMEDRGEGFLQMFFRMMGQGIAQQSKQQATGKSTDLDILMAMFQPDRALRLKRMMAEQFEDMETMLVGFSGPDGSTIITERNKKALDVLSKQIAQGRKKLGVFYGAGHMDDMHKRLRDEFKLEPVQTFWVDAWNLRSK